MQWKWQASLSLLFLGGFCLILLLGSCTPKTQDRTTTKAPTSLSTSPPVIRIGHQPLGTFLYLKIKGNLEKRLAPLGTSVIWTEFPAGRAILAAMNEGKIDMGYAGVVPPVFAQANNVPFVYVANDASVPGSVGILAHQDSPIQTLADLKGKKIAATQASVGHYLLIQALAKGGLTFKDIDFVDMLPQPGQEAFKQKKVEVWVGWQPFLGELQTSTPVRLLTDGKGLVYDRNFYLATREFADRHGNLVNIVIEEAQVAGHWVSQNPEEAAAALSAKTGIKKSAALLATKGRRYEALPIQDRAVEEQQRVAETFFRLGLLPQRIQVEDAVWKQGLKQ